MTASKSFSLKAPKGRAKGFKPKPQPQTVAEFVNHALAEPMQPPPKPLKERKRACVSSGIWATLKTPEKRSQYARWLASRRKPENMARTERRTGTPNGWSHEAAQAAFAQAELEASRLVAKMQAQGIIAKKDKETAEATKAALVMVRAPGGERKKKERMAERLLETFHPAGREAANA